MKVKILLFAIFLTFVSSNRLLQGSSTYTILPTTTTTTKADCGCNNAVPTLSTAVNSGSITATVVTTSLSSGSSSTTSSGSDVGCNAPNSLTTPASPCNTASSIQPCSATTTTSQNGNCNSGTSNNGGAVYTVSSYTYASGDTPKYTHQNIPSDLQSVSKKSSVSYTATTSEPATYTATSTNEPATYTATSTIEPTYTASGAATYTATSGPATYVPIDDTDSEQEDTQYEENQGHQNYDSHKKCHQKNKICDHVSTSTTTGGCQKTATLTQQVPSKTCKGNCQHSCQSGSIYWTPQSNPLCSQFVHGVCKTCSNRSFKNSKGLCILGDQLCAKFTKTGKCLQCYVGYMKSAGRCQVRPQKFQHCRQMAHNRCTKCEHMYYLSKQNLCGQVSVSCKTYDECNGDCTSCYSGYTLTEGECKIQ